MTRTNYVEGFTRSGKLSLVRFSLLGRLAALPGKQVECSSVDVKYRLLKVLCQNGRSLGNLNMIPSQTSNVRMLALRAAAAAACVRPTSC